jgi:hypothetical protein
MRFYPHGGSRTNGIPTIDDFFRGFPSVPWLKDFFALEKPIAVSASSNILAGKGRASVTMSQRREYLGYGRSGYHWKDSNGGDIAVATRRPIRGLPNRGVAMT